MAADDILWAALERALPHTLRVHDAGAVSSPPGRDDAMYAALTQIAVQDDVSHVLLAWACTAALPCVPGADLFAGHLAVPSPAPWVPLTAEAVDAARDGDIGKTRSRLAAAGNLGPGNLRDLIWQLYHAADDVLARAGGARPLHAIWQRHRENFNPRHWPAPSAAVVLGTASLAVAAIAAGDREYGRQALDRCFQRDPDAVRLMASTWFKLSARLVREKPGGSTLSVLRMDRDGVPEEFITGAQDEHGAVGEVVADIVAAMAAADEERTAAALERVTPFTPAQWAMMADVLAGSLGLEFSRQARTPGT